ncbi:hypothetical protein BC628DRAFT_1322650 [Trametes gibbosa]|nr:hypothetical protein BC628DRAFT_1322650 [Trametes gibbosa]
MPSLRKYGGSVRKMVLGIDVGTTYSGVSYVILDPGEVPIIEGVRRFPGQENAAGDNKIPSILYYNPDGTVHSAGAEAAAPGMDLEAEDIGLTFVEWFKLHLRPSCLDSMGDAVSTALEVRPLPSGKSVTDVFADFLAYLYRCTRTYISDVHASGESIWDSFEDRIDFVLSHPNGWEGLQQGKMREAAIKAKLVPNTAAGHARVHFVTEGEASLNYCVRHGFANTTIQTGTGITVIDAGGGTIDISSYSFLSSAPISVEEVVSSDCLLQGSTRVNVRAEQFLRERLRDSAYGNDEDIKSMLEHFDKSTKPVFKDATEPSYIKFGSMRCNDHSVNIRRGQLTLSGNDMESFFKPSFEAIIESMQKQRQSAGVPLTASTVFLVGGYAASPWLKAALQGKLNALGLRLFRPDSHTSKAVAEGAVSFYLENFVSARVARLTYGVEISTTYQKADPEHYARRAGKYIDASGTVLLRNGFSNIGRRMREGEELSQSYHQNAHDTRTLDSLVADVLCYRGKESDPQWVDVRPELFAPLCTIYADTSAVQRKPNHSSKGTYYTQNFDVIIICGLTELQAQISWIENVSLKRLVTGPASIVYEEDVQLSH